MTIYTSKKNGARFTNLTQIAENKFQLTSVEDPADTIIVTESTLKRWYKKTVEVDFTSAEEKPEESKPAKKAPKIKEQSKPAKASEEIIDMTFEEASAKFKGFRIDEENVRVCAGVFHPRKATFIDDKTVQFNLRHSTYRVSL